MISIVMATYNGAKFINEQIDSILGQTYKDIEIIVIDDASRDNTVNMVQENFEKNRFSNFKVIQNKSNIGPTKSFEKAVLECSGRYIAICDQDDIWYREKLTRYLEVAKDTEADIIYAPSLILKKGKVIRSVFPPQQTFQTLFSLLLHNNARGATMMIRKDFIDKLIPFSDLYDKWIYFIGCLYGKIAFINEPLHLYRIHENNYNAGRFRFSSKGNLLIKLKSSIEFYRNFLLFVQGNGSINASFSHQYVLITISNIIKFHEAIICCLNSKNIIARMIKYMKNVIGKEFTNMEKLIYLYYFVVKIR